MSHDQALDGLISALIQQKKISEQSELQASLAERGYDIPQATLSRRLKKLNIAKVAGIYQCVEFNMPSLPLILKIDISEFGLIVLHTHPGQANSLAYFLDQKYIRANDCGLLATVAGDDTILLVVKNQASIQATLKCLYKDFPYLTEV